MYKLSHTSITALFLTLLLFITLCAPSPVNAGKNNSTSIQYLYLPADKLSTSLQLLANKFNIPFSFNPLQVNDKVSPLIQGHYTLTGALDLLLKDTQLSYRTQGTGFVLFLTPSNIIKTPEIEEITVKGIRYALAKSRFLKDKSTVISEAISAQDITDIPNTNLAEALQHIPGVTITREAGEGRQVSIRSSYPDFSLVTLNAMPVLANNDSPMDSRVQKQRDRSFDFNILPAELFKQIQVFKTYSAEQPAGGIAGTLALQTVNPSDNKGLQFIITPELGYNGYVGTGAKRFSSLLSNTWGNWGVLGSVAYTERSSLEQGANTFRWRNIALTGADLSALNDDVANGLLQGDYTLPRGNRYSVWQSEQQRFGANFSLEYKTATTHIDIDFLGGFLKAERYESHLYPRGSQSTPIIDGLTAITEVQFNQNNELIYANYKHARVATESRVQTIETTYQQGGASLSHQFNDDFGITAVVGQEQSDYTIPYSNKIYTQGVSDVSIDYRNSPYYSDINYSADLQDTNMWSLNHGDLEQYYSHSRYLFASLTFKYTLTNHLTWQWGADWTQFTNSMFNPQQNDLFFSDITNNTEYLTHLPSELITAQNAHQHNRWLKIDTNKALSYYGIDPFDLQNNNFDIVSESEHINEFSRGVFALARITKSKWEAHVGLRYQSDTINAYSITKNPTVSYALLLPTLNTTYHVNEGFKIRAALAVNYAKPLLESLTDMSSTNIPDDTQYVFNPQLKPYLAYNADIAFALQFTPQNRVDLSFFYKDLQDYIVITEVPASYTEQFNSQASTLLWQDNAETAYQWGAELNINYVFPRSHWGINLQAAYNQGKVSYYNALTGQALFKKELPYLSKITASSMLFYERNKLNFKIGAIFRDKYLVRAGSLLIDEDETGFLPTTYWDASINYYLSHNWKVKFNAFNLTNEQERQYSHSTLRAYNTTTSGRTFYLGASFQY